MFKLTITQPGSALPVIHEQEITPMQVSSVVALIKAEGLTYGDVLRFLADHRPGLDTPAGAGDEVEAYRG